MWRLLRNRDLHDAWRSVAADGCVLSCCPQRAEFLHDDAGFVTAARFAVELSKHNVHDGPRD